VLLREDPEREVLSTLPRKTSKSKSLTYTRADLLGEALCGWCSFARDVAHSELENARTKAAGKRNTLKKRKSFMALPQGQTTRGPLKKADRQ
jgi:hypothetical protein